jgi:hypothetical protein
MMRLFQSLCWLVCVCVCTQCLTSLEWSSFWPSLKKITSNLHTFSQCLKKSSTVCLFLVRFMAVRAVLALEIFGHYWQVKLYGSFAGSNFYRGCWRMNLK